MKPCFTISPEKGGCIVARKIRKPAYVHHKPTGQGRIRIGGKDIYLGEYGTPDSRARYEAHIAQWLAQNCNPDAVHFTIDELALLYMGHAREYYQKDGEPTSELNNVQIALRPLLEVCGTIPVSRFRATDLIRVRNAMIASECVRTSINRQIGRIKLMFRWGHEQGRVSEVVLSSIDIAGLKAGRSKAIESDPVNPVSDAAVDAIQSFVSRQVWAMIELQRLTGMRAGEVCSMRGCDLNTAGTIWEYKPRRHKTEHHGRARIVMLGPLAQKIIREFLKADTQAFLFSPADARLEFDARRKAERKTPMKPSQAERQPLGKPTKAPGGRYTVTSYGQAIRKGCEVAFGMPAELRNVSTKLPAERRKALRVQAHAWRRAHCWHSHQLRHTAATNIRREFGLETSRITLGHATIAMAELYAEPDMQKSREAMLRLG